MSRFEWFPRRSTVENGRMSDELPTSEESLESIVDPERMKEIVDRVLQEENGARLLTPIEACGSVDFVDDEVFLSGEVVAFAIGVNRIRLESTAVEDGVEVSVDNQD